MKFSRAEYPLLMSWKNELIKITRGKILENEPLSKHTTFRVGGPCNVFLEPADENDLSVCLRFLRSEKIPHFILGQGSNVLFPDSGYKGCILKVGSGLRNLDYKSDEIVAGSGILLHSFIGELAERGLSGLEGLSGIPGTIGGAICMNAGAFGQTISEVLRWVEFIDETGGRRQLFKKDLLFRYRWSIFQNLPDWVIVSAGLTLQPDSPDRLKSKLREYSDKRKRTQPWNFPSAGSFFKNPDGRSAGSLIEQAGLKGVKFGGAEVSPVHANFIVNTGGATCSDVLSLMRDIQNKVRSEFGVSLEPEVKIIPEQAVKLIS